MSGNTVPYHLRVNKFVDRQLFLELIENVARYQPMGDVAYISMGGGYLEDFRVLHQAFGIRRMLSFDMDAWMIDRQEVNKPYGFIRCKCAKSEEIIRDFDNIRHEMVGDDGRLIIWLDYTEASMRHDQLYDLEQLTKKLNHGDIFRITMNAYRPSFGNKEGYQLARRAEETDALTITEWWNNQLVDQLKDYMPDDRKDAEFMSSDDEFAITLGRAAKIAAQNGMRTRNPLLIEPLMSIVYADKQQMITITGIVLGESQRDLFRERFRWGEWPYDPGPRWDNFVRLGVPHLSVKERHQVHDLIGANGQADLSGVHFKLNADPAMHESMLQQYLRHYRRYPTFAPVDNM
ncbi:O-methyltransferase [Zavarzinella formosa]|uniref:O-methyltransferase n=1 Tax=Zavarzinella formosa TaxID=360055 RepID=UPI0002F1FE1D|nr:O-methyltransferase [Zavarzinella formosa]